MYSLSRTTAVTVALLEVGFMPLVPHQLLQGIGQRLLHLLQRFGVRPFLQRAASLKRSWTYNMRHTVDFNRIGPDRTMLLVWSYNKPFAASVAKKKKKKKFHLCCCGKHTLSAEPFIVRRDHAGIDDGRMAELVVSCTITSIKIYTRVCVCVRRQDVYLLINFLKRQL